MRAIILIVIVILFVIFFATSSEYFSVKVRACPTCEAYSVSAMFDDKQEAAQLMHNVDMNVTKLLTFMENKYLARDNLDYVRFNLLRSDVVNGIENIRKRFSHERFTEISPGNIMGNTSYTENKNTLIVCLRHKTGPQKGELYDINTVMFVVLHELAHMMNNDWGHKQHFWDLFSFLLHNAEEAGIYYPVDYSQTPLNYCGINIRHNPYYM